MAEAHWEGLHGEELRFRDHTWELTGEVDVRRAGELVRARARQVDGVKHRNAVLKFGLDGAGGSLNPGNLGTVTARLERVNGGHFLVVGGDRRTYRYELQSMEYV